MVKGKRISPACVSKVSIAIYWLFQYNLLLINANGHFSNWTKLQNYYYFFHLNMLNKAIRIKEPTCKLSQKCILKPNLNQTIFVFKLKVPIKRSPVFSWNITIVVWRSSHFMSVVIWMGPFENKKKLHLKLLK